MRPEHVVIIGNGPSASDLSQAINTIPDPKIIVRMNFFFLENGAPYGTDVDHYFWAVNRERLHEELRRTVRNKEYTIQNFHCPVPPDRLDYKSGKVIEDPFWNPEDGLNDHWEAIADANPRLARVFMSRPLPTAGTQALAYFACKGYRKFHLFGMDFYQSADKRYAYEIPADIAADLGTKHTQPGYEAGAHSLDGDLNFLRAILREYPEVDISYNGYFDTITELLAEPRAASDKDVSRSGGHAVVRDLAGGSEDRSSFVKLEQAFRNSEDRLNRLERDNKRLHKQLSDTRNEFAKTNTSLYRLFASEGLPYSDVLWVVHEMSSLAGVHRPLSAYLHYSDILKQARSKVINLSDSNRASVRYTADYVQSRPHRLVLNSIACFEDKRVQTYVARAHSKALYLHETEWTISEFAKKNPFAYKEFLKFIETGTVFCVSEKQKSYVEEQLGAAKAVLVHNTVDTMLDTNQRKLRRALPLRKSSEGSLRIGMVGSYQPRKGARLFSDVAETMHAVRPDISFEWVGKHHSGGINRNALTFHGPLPPKDTQSFIDNLDVLFLPSFDDPQPLAALEALSRGTKLICFEGIGTAEWVKGIPGCEVFSEYTTEAAIESLQKVLASDFDYEAIDAALREHFDPETFTEKMCQAIDDMPSFGQPDLSSRDAVQRHHRAHAKQHVIAAAQLKEESGDSIWEDIATKAIALREDPGNVIGYFQLARQLRYNNEINLANQIAEAGLRANVGKASANREMAVYLAEMGELQSALEHAEEAVDRNPSSDAAHSVLKRIRDLVHNTAADAAAE